ncbi:MAG: radical SAM protein [Desulfonatronovibrio sp. MSAO_Bac4]|nr:MAG: radical SAM protein [Desulfonatronovibrio sp. MSAO_Bac4]
MKPARTYILQFHHPEPERPRNPIWPVFLPFIGCPFKCIFCSQNSQTGQESTPLKQNIGNMVSGITARYEKTGKPVSLGFFGGTFTAMPVNDMIIILDQAEKLKNAGLVDHTRCSTRPDCITPDRLEILRNMKVDMIELGIQSFDDQTLKASRRGYTRDKAVQACMDVKQAGFDLGIQLMGGLPGSDHGTFFKDINTTSEIVPEIVRLYPCLVLKDTPLEKAKDQELFRPWGLTRTFHTLALALLKLWSKKISVIRIGLTPEKSLIKNIIAGPWHPAMGSICKSMALKNYLMIQLAKTEYSPNKILIPNRYTSDFWGHKGMNKELFTRKKITRQNVEVWDRDYFRVYFT